MPPALVIFSSVDHWWTQVYYLQSHNPPLDLRLPGSFFHYTQQESFSFLWWAFSQDFLTAELSRCYVNGKREEEWQGWGKYSLTPYLGAMLLLQPSSCSPLFPSSTVPSWGRGHVPVFYLLARPPSAATRHWASLSPSSNSFYQLLHKSQGSTEHNISVYNIII